MEELHDATIAVRHTHLTIEIDIVSADGGAKYALLALLAIILLGTALCGYIPSKRKDPK